MHKALISLLRAAHMPSRIVTGVDLHLAQDKQPIHWVELYIQDGWKSLDVVNRYKDGLPSSYIPLRKGSERVLITDENIQTTNQVWEIVPTKFPHGMFTSKEASWLSIFDLTRLAPSTRNILGLLMLLPIGVLLTEALRQLIGVRTYGIFTPTLLALAAVYADKFTAAIIFALVIVAGITGRSMLPRLELSRTSRVSVIFVIVVMTMTLVVSSLTYIDSTTDSAVVLLPIVILTMLIDRIYTLADKYGMRKALIRLIWTTIAATVSFFVLLRSDWAEMILAYPEIHTVTLLCIILLGPCRNWCMANLPWFKRIQIHKTDDSEA
ncbi:MAG: hypothetical protein ACI9IA_000107 [Enterobacterales bacterium]|jgi:hypothetical protein